jgi:ABC-type sugar transport system substrate-binding protein
MARGMMIQERLSRRAAATWSKLPRSIFALVLGGGLLVLGCDSASFVAPRPAELGGGDSSAGPVSGAGAGGARSAELSTRTIELITGPLNSGYSEGVKKIARIQAGLDAALIQINVAGEDGKPLEAPALAQSALARNPKALVLYFLDESEPAMAGVITQARAKGVPVVVIAGPRAGLQSSKAKAPDAQGGSTSTPAPLVHVVPESLTAAARSIVEAAIRNARNAKLKPEEGAILTINEASDSLVEERAEALREVLKSEGIKTIQDLRFSGNLGEAKERVIELLRAHLKAVIVVSADHIGLTASFQAMSEMGPQRPYVVAGFTPEESGGNMTKTGEFAAVAIYSPERLLRKAVYIAASLGRGEKVADRVEVIVPTLVSPEDSTTGKMYRMNQRQPRDRRPN